ncbi:MAG TPA: alanine racemase [Ilumatobacteraceae bacterium]|nr:alanine racemase [Ilumatobacteraceae bacterium]
MSGADASARWVWADVDLDAIAHNVEHLRSVVAPSAVWAVVKANGYGHGAVEVARAAIDAGAQGLCVALAEEGAQLRVAGVDAPILVLSEQPVEAADDIVRFRLMATVYTAEFVDALASAAQGRGVDGVPVHLKIDTGMQRVGVAVDGAAAMVAAVEAHAPALRLVGVFTHLALADEPGDPFTDDQLARFDEALADVASVLPGTGPGGTDDALGLLVHAANSAGALAHPSARRSFVRAGIAIYGISPGGGVDALCGALRPAMSLEARVSFVKRVKAGSRISYGLRHTFERDTTVATVPIGYADGVPRRLFETGGEVLIGGRRRPIVGVVTMDQLMVDCGDDTVGIGDRVVLIGSQDGPDGRQTIRAEDWADRLGTIGYEIVCGIGGRVPRRHARNIDSAMSGRDDA